MADRIDKLMTLTRQHAHRKTMRYVRSVLHRELNSLCIETKREPDVTKRYDIGIKIEEVKALIVQFGGRA